MAVCAQLQVKMNGRIKGKFLSLREMVLVPPQTVSVFSCFPFSEDRWYLETTFYPALPDSFETFWFSCYMLEIGVALDSGSSYLN